jgi:hypothetical protein
MGDKAASIQVFFAVKTSALTLEIFQQAIEPRAPIRRAEYQQKVIPANMADKVPCRINPVIQALRQTEQYFIAFGVAVEVEQCLRQICCKGTPIKTVRISQKSLLYLSYRSTQLIKFSLALKLLSVNYFCQSRLVCL